MQRKLFEAKRREGYTSRDYVCVCCTLDPNSREASKIQARYVRRKLRPLLEHVVGNIWRQNEKRFGDLSVT